MSKKKNFLIGIIVGMMLWGSLFIMFAGIAQSASPTVASASPDDDDTYVTVDAGDGVTITVNVTDGDGDIEQMEIWSNASGSWSALYQSGALGGVAYHEHSVVDGDALESWTLYYYNISVYDTSTADWTNVTYSYTTAYVWGDIQPVYMDLSAGTPDNYAMSVMYKDEDNDYYFLAGGESSDGGIVGSNGLDAKRTTNKGLNWMYITSANVDEGIYPSTAFTYNNQPTFFFVNGDTESASEGGEPFTVRKLYYAKWNGASWDTGNIENIYQYARCVHDSNSWSASWGIGSDVIYYDGTYHILAGYCRNLNGEGDTSSEAQLAWYYGTPLTSFTKDGGTDGYIEKRTNGAMMTYKYWWIYPCLEILDGYMVVVYNDTGNDLHWRTYDGVTWTNKNDIEADIGDGCSMVKDPSTGNLVAVYVDGSSGYLNYRTLASVSGSWSSEHLVATPPSGCHFRHPNVEYIDDRLIITVSCDLRAGYWNIYSISAPDNRDTVSGIVEQYGRYEFPDASPNDLNVNSTAVRYENIGHTDWLIINLTSQDIGSIQRENNFRFWFSKDGVSYTDVGTTDGSGVITDIDEASFPAIMPIETGEDLYVIWEILDIGDVVEDLHSDDYGLQWEIYHP